MAARLGGADPIVEGAGGRRVVREGFTLDGSIIDL
jgi:hypothetical protein